MALKLSQIRVWFGVAALLAILGVAGAYLYARYRVQNALKQIPEKIGLEIQQAANGFSISKSAEGHTIFKIEASKVVQFKQGGRAELHDVQITLYGRQSDRFDRIRGAKFDYDQRTGDVTAEGEVQIDLAANPEGGNSPDQSAPAQQKNPIQVTTSGLIFNQKTGNASTSETVNFTLPQATGSAVGVNYVGKTGVMTLTSQIDVAFQGVAQAHVKASHATITKEPRTIVLNEASLQTADRRSEAQTATIFLRQDNSVDRVLAEGSVHVKAGGAKPTEVRSSQLELSMRPERDVLQTAVFSGDVRADSDGTQPMQATAGRIILNFAGKNVLQTIRSEQNVHIVSQQQPSSAKLMASTANRAPSSSPQNMELTAPQVDFYLSQGRKLQRADTVGSPQVIIRPADASPGDQRTIITAGRFEANFDAAGQLSSIRGAPNARIISHQAGDSDRVSTSNSLEMAFQSGKGLGSVLQQGDFVYADGERKAWASSARYTPSDQVLSLTGSPRVVDGGLTATSRSMRFNRATGDAVAEGDVKSTYSDLRPQPGGALLASGDPIHVTAQMMIANRSPSVATYKGDARLWQNANVIQAPTLEFNRDRRSVDADGTPTQPVSTVLVQTDKNGKTTPITISAKHFLYTDNERRAHYSGGVQVKAVDINLAADEMDAYLQARGQTSTSTLAGTGQLERIVAKGGVLITQPERHGSGEQLVYTSADDKFVLSGGTPSIFDAEHGQVTGVSLTLFRHDDRVLVMGSEAAPTFTHTRVAR